MPRQSLVARKGTAARRHLEQMSLADAPDYRTAIAAGLAHGLTPFEAVKSAFGKWLTTNAADVQRFKLANFYARQRRQRRQGAFVNYTHLLRFLTIVVADQAMQIDALVAALHPSPARLCLPAAPGSSRPASAKRISARSRPSRSSAKKRLSSSR